MCITNKWILCEKQMPKEGQPVLVCDKNGNVCIRTIIAEINGKKYWSQCKYDVIKWRPLPDPYEDDSIDVKEPNNIQEKLQIMMKSFINDPEIDKKYKDEILNKIINLLALGDPEKVLK